jgi:DNA-binding response OmpR family regulator
LQGKEPVSSERQLRGSSAKAVRKAAQPALDGSSAIPGVRIKSALLVSPLSEDHEFLGQLFARQNWKLYGARTLGSALVLLRDQPVPVVISERDLPLGNWCDLFEAISKLPWRPLLVVTSHLADEYLWAEVLNIDAYSVLAKPFDLSEVVRVLDSAWRRSESRGVWRSNQTPGAAGCQRTSAKAKRTKSGNRSRPTLRRLVAPGKPW